MKTINVVIIAVVIAAASFFGGMKFRDYQISKTRANFANGNFRGQFPGGANAQNGTTNGNNNRFAGARPVEGEIVSMDNNSVTVKMPDGSTKIIILSDSTTYNKATEGSKSDLQTGSQILVTGTENSDGSMTAQNIQLNPMFRFSGGQGTVTPSPSQ
jgi:hypothetical protein